MDDDSGIVEPAGAVERRSTNEGEADVSMNSFITGVLSVRKLVNVMRHTTLGRKRPLSNAAFHVCRF